jgi:hypothetical protein
LTNSQKQEQQIARYLNGQVQPNSGGTKFGGGDVHTKYFLIEAKTSETIKESFSIKHEWIKKAAEQAFEQGKPYSAVAFRFSPNGDDYFIIGRQTMKLLMDYMEGKVY